MDVVISDNVTVPRVYSPCWFVAHLGSD